MSTIREWASVICMAALAAALLQSLAPNGAMERMAKFVIGAFVICAIILPLSKAVPKLSLGLKSGGGEVSSNAGFSSAVDSQIETAARKSISNLITAQLKSMNIRCKNVAVNMDTDANGRISINKVIVTLGEENTADRQRVSASLEKTLGLKTEVVTDGGSEKSG